MLNIFSNIKNIFFLSTLTIVLLFLIFFLPSGFINKQDSVKDNEHNLVFFEEFTNYPDDAQGLFEQGQIYFASERYDLKKARNFFEQALIKDQKVSALAWYQLGRIDFLEGKFKGALFKFEQQIHHFGNEVPTVHYMLGLTYGYRARQSNSFSDWQLAEEAFKEYIELDPFSPWARTDLAWVYFSQGKYEEIKPVVEEGLRTAPKHAWLLNMYGLALLNTGKKDLANEYFVQAYDESQKLTLEDWGRAYPGNDPRSWQKGLNEMRKAIKHNITVSL